jgi:hypothetical protein
MTSISLAAVFWLGIVAGPLRLPVVEKLGERAFRGNFFAEHRGAGVVHRRLPSGALGPTMADNSSIGLARFCSRVPGVSSHCGRRRAHESDQHRLIASRLRAYIVLSTFSHREIADCETSQRSDNSRTDQLSNARAARI